MTMRTWSPQQNAVFEWFRVSKKNGVVRARAGTGKTTTILEGISHAPEKDIMLCAFNKKIAEELKGKLQNPCAQAKTLHAIGNSIISRYWDRPRIDSARGEAIAAKVCARSSRAAGGIPDPIIRLVTKLASAGKNMVPAGRVEDLEAVAEAMDIMPDEEWEEEGYDVSWLAYGAHLAMEAAANERDGSIDFDDMLFIPVRNRWVRPKYDLVVVDEAQDMNVTQLLLARGMCRGRLLVVGDDRQAIYGFRGADSQSIDRLKNELSAVEMPLTITYRCPKSIVEYAQRLVPDYQAAPEAPEGKISTSSVEGCVKAAAPGDFVLSRKNAPLITVALKLARAGKRVRIEGRDFGAGLASVVRKLRARSIPEFLSKLSTWEEKQRARASKAKSEKAAEEAMESVTDQAETLRQLAEGLTGPAELLTRIEGLFSSDGGPTVMLSSVHRSKGLETDRVFILRKTLYPGKRENIEEKNIEYVAVTRAKAELVWIEEEVA